MKNFTTTKRLTIRQIHTVIINTLFVFSILMLLTVSAHARGAPESFADLAEELSPSVVNITTSTTIAGVTDQARHKSKREVLLRTYLEIFLITVKEVKQGQEEVVLLVQDLLYRLMDIS